MPKITITADDLKKGKVLNPGMYAAEITEVEEQQSKTDGSQNYNLEFKILRGPVQTDGFDPSGCKVYRTYNEKGMGFFVPLLDALGVKIDPAKGISFDLDALVGKKLNIYVTNEEYKGQMKNRVDGFAPLS